MREPRDNADAEALDLEQARLILGGAPEVRDRLATDPRVLMGVWGVAWLVGYLALWFTSRPTSTASAAASEFAAPAVWAFIVFYGLLVLAVVVTIIHVTRRGRGLKGASATSGTMYGLIWPIAFTVVGMILGALGASELLDPRAMALVANALPCVVVGTLYMAGGAMERDWAWFILGAWIAVIAGIGTMVGVPHTYLVMARAGGGGMLLGGLGYHLARRRERGTT